MPRDNMEKYVQEITKNKKSNDSDSDGEPELELKYKKMPEHRRKSIEAIDAETLHDDNDDEPSL